VESLNRTPPKAIQEVLRREVNFGCPIPGCGIPYLTWHHFDPPWGTKQHHNPEGMIALCAKDAALADGKRWTKNQLRQMKKKPYVSPNQISEHYGYLRKNVVTIIGNVAYNVKNVLEIYGERVIGFERDNEGYNRLNLLIRNKNAKPILVMKNNFWTAISKDLFDLRCSAQGKELEITSKDKQTKLFMRFDDFPLDAFKKKLLKNYQEVRSKVELPEWLDEEEMECIVNDGTYRIDEFVSEIGSPEIVPTWTIKGKLLWGNVHLEIHNSFIENLVTHNIFGMNFMIGATAAFSFTGQSTFIG
jgi:hypothetical protein